MTQDISTSTESPTSDVQADSLPVAIQTAGALLRHYRETQEVDIDILASSLKVPVNKLVSLESDRLDELPDAMFARALALAVCRILKVDAAPVLALLPGQDVSRLAPKDERGIDFPLQRPSFLPQSKLLTTAGLFTPMRGGAVLALLVALVLAFWPDVQTLIGGKDTTPANAVMAPVTESVVSAVPAASPASAVVDVAPSGLVVVPVQSMATAASAAVPAVAPVATPAPVSASGAGHVR
jgi:cytoskeleton protein RodZ